MNEVLKQRLVGALILLALGVIFWPIIFVQPEDSELVQQRTIPPQPNVSTAPMDAPDRVGLRPSPQRPPEPEPEPLPQAPETEAEDVLVANAASQTDAPVQVETAAAPTPPAAEQAPQEPAALPREQTRSERPEPLAMDAQGVPVAWILQVASVSSAEKAESLRKRLLAVDEKAYVARVSSGGRDLYRVYIGPKFEKAKLESLRGRIDAEFGVTSMIRRYVP